ncbi:MAG: hypothetical protein ACP5M4_15195, partial [Acidobacteriaceae bacterium]
MDINLSNEVTYQPCFQASLSCEESELPLQIKKKPSHKVVQIDRQEVSSWALSDMRRGFDIIASAFALTLFLPIMGAVAIAVRFSSRGPILFQQ